MTDRALSEAERTVLGVLMAARARPADRTTQSLVGRTRLGTKLRVVLRELATREPPLVEHGLDGVLGDIVWEATRAAAETMDQPNHGR
jgi:hypothetical protein